MKRTAAFVLALLICLTLLPTGGFAADAAPEPAAEVRGETSIGSLLADKIDESLTSGDCVRALTLDAAGLSAEAEYSVSRNARLVVGVYEESSGAMTASGSADAAAGSGKARVALTGEIPVHYIARAFLLDAETGAPLAEPFVLSAQTAAMKALEAATVDDFDPARVVNLDADPTCNFVVLSQDVKTLSAGSVTVEDDHLIISGAALAPGDLFCWYEGEDPVILRAAKVEGARVWPDAETPEEAFEVIKIDTDAVPPTLQDVDCEGSTCVSLKIQKEFGSAEQNEGFVSGTLSGSLGGKLTIGVSLRLYHIRDYTEFSFKFREELIELGGDLVGKCSFTIPLTAEPVTLRPIPGVYITIRPAIRGEMNAQTHLGVSAHAEAGVQYLTGRGFEPILDGPAINDEGLELTVEGTLFLGIDLQPAVNVLYFEKDSLRGGVLQASLEAAAGPEFKMTRGPESAGRLAHGCYWCAGGTLSLKAEISGEIESSLRVLRVKGKLVDGALELGKCYLSQAKSPRDGGKVVFGLGECPGISLRCTVTVHDQDCHKELPGARLSFYDQNGTLAGSAQLPSGRWSEATVYLPLGKLSVVAVWKNERQQSTITVTRENDLYDVPVDLGETVTVTVLDEAGEPVPGAILRGTPWDDLAFTTDESGQAIIPLPEGQYALRACVYDEEGEISAWAGKSVTVRGRSEVTMTTQKQEMHIAYDEESGVLRVSGSGPMPDYSFAVGGAQTPFMDYGEVCKRIEIHGMSTVGDWAFSNFHAVESVWMDDSVVAIGQASFIHDYKLSDVRFSDQLVQLAVGYGGTYDSIGAFEGCSALRHIELPESLVTIGEQAFRASGLTALTLPKSVYSIGKKAFQNCGDLEFVIFNDGLRVIESYAFQNDTRLGSVTLPKLDVIGGSVFTLGDDFTDILFTGAMPRFEGYPVEEPSEERDDLTIWYPKAWDAARLNGWPESSRLSWKAYEP